MRNLFISCLLFLCYSAQAQYTDKDFTAVDAHAKKVGKLDSLNMGSIAALVTKPFSEKVDKARAIYTWIAINITYDLKAAKNNDPEKSKSADVLKFRKGIGLGFAKLYQDMCSVVGIRCLVADGYVIRNFDDLEAGVSEINHSWTVVQLGQSPDTWYYVDAALASGKWDNDFKVFTKEYSDKYFFTDKALFNKQHFPDNIAWLLGAGPKTRDEFNKLPWLRTAGIEYGLKSAVPALARFKAKNNEFVSFNLRLAEIEKVSAVKIKYGNPKKPKIKDAIFDFSGSAIVFKHKFELADEYPVTIEVDGKDLITYFATIEEVQQ